MRTYPFHPTESDPTTLVLTIRTSWYPSYMDDLDTSEVVLYQYADFSHTLNVRHTSPTSMNMCPRGLVVLVNEDSGVAVTVLGSREISIQEEPTIWEGGHTKDQ